MAANLLLGTLWLLYGRPVGLVAITGLVEALWLLLRVIGWELAIVKV